MKRKLRKLQKANAGRVPVDGKGRPTVITEAVIQTLVEAFRAGASIREAAACAGVSKSAVCNYLKNNLDFQDKIQTLGATPSVMAKMVVFKAIQEGSVDVSRWLLEIELKRSSERERAKTLRAQRKALAIAGTVNAGENPEKDGYLSTLIEAMQPSSKEAKTDSKETNEKAGNGTNVSG